MRWLFNVLFTSTFFIIMFQVYNIIQLISTLKKPPFLYLTCIHKMFYNEYTFVGWCNFYLHKFQWLYGKSPLLCQGDSAAAQTDFWPVTQGQIASCYFRRVVQQGVGWIVPQETIGNVWRYFGLSQLRWGWGKFHNWGSGIYWIEARHAANHPAMYRTAPTAQNYLASKHQFCWGWETLL